MPENQNIEWKAKWKDDYLEWICGFANAQGGKIYIGCDDDGKVIGLPNIRKLLEDVPNKIRNAMSIVVDVNQLERDGKEYLEIVVPPYPVAINCKGVYYYRSGSTMQDTCRQEGPDRPKRFRRGQSGFNGKAASDQCRVLYQRSDAAVLQRP